MKYLHIEFQFIFMLENVFKEYVIISLGKRRNWRQHLQIRDKCSLCFHLLHPDLLVPSLADGVGVLQGLQGGHEAEDSNGENDKH